MLPHNKILYVLYCSILPYNTTLLYSYMVYGSVIPHNTNFLYMLYCSILPYNTTPLHICYMVV